MLPGSNGVMEAGQAPDFICRAEGSWGPGDEQADSKTSNKTESNRKGMGR